MKIHYSIAFAIAAAGLGMADAQTATLALPSAPAIGQKTKVALADAAIYFPHLKPVLPPANDAGE